MLGSLGTRGEGKAASQQRTTCIGFKVVRSTGVGEASLAMGQSDCTTNATSVVNPTADEQAQQQPRPTSSDEPSIQSALPQRWKIAYRATPSFTCQYLSALKGACPLTLEPARICEPHTAVVTEILRRSLTVGCAAGMMGLGLALPSSRV